MASESKGPDLAKDGVAFDALLDGKMTTGFVNDESILLVRRGAEVFAVGAKCTHYGGPLEKGLLVDDTVRCPWHHACFDLRTGEALRAPALDPVACWNVEQRDGRVYVTSKQERAPLEPTAKDLETAEKATHPGSVVIVGAGAAGNAAAEMLRRCAYLGKIIMIDSDTSRPYDRPSLSKDYLSGDIDEDYVMLRSEDFEKENGIDLIRGNVASINVGGRTVEMEDGSSIGYDSLLLATGAEPRALDIPGHDLPHVHLLRTWSDSQAIVKAAAQAKQVVVIGSSFIGLEVAASLRAKKIEVHIVAPDEVPLAKKMGPQIGALVQSLHEEHGVKFHLQRKPVGITNDSVTLDNGEKLAADLVVAGVGVAPRVDLARKADLNIGNGVEVNEYLETSSPGIYAAGDIACWPDPHSGQRIRVEHWVLAQAHGQTVARNILGAKEKFERAPFFWSQHYDTSIRYVGHAEKWDRIDLDGDVAKREFSAAFRNQGKTLAVASVKRDLQNLQAGLALESDDEDALQSLIKPKS